MIFKNLRLFITKRTVVFLMFVLAQIFTLIGVFIIFNYVEATIDEQKSSYEERRTYIVQLVDNTSLDGQLEAVLELPYDMQYVYTMSNVGDYYLYGDYYGQSVNNAVMYGDYFSEEDIENGTKNIVIPESIASDYDNTGESYDVGDTYILNGESYTILGISGFGDSFFVPYKSLAATADILAVCVVTDEELSDTETKDFVNNLEKIFNSAYVVSPEIDDSQFDSFKLMMVVVALLLCLGIFNLSYLYMFILEQRRKQYAIFQICGCTRVRGVMIYLGEIFLISAGVFVLSALLFRFIVLPVIAIFDPFTVIALPLPSYLGLFVCYIAVMFCVFLPGIIKYASRSVSLQYKN